MPSENDLFEIQRTTRAMRRLKPDQVPDELVQKILAAGMNAASGGNSQRWRFLVIKDQSIKEKVQKYYKRAFDEVVSPRYLSSEPPPGSSPGRYRRQHGAVEYLTDHYHEAPIWIVACQDDGQATPTRSSGASIYPAVQNIMLAARALGLGTVLTTIHTRHEQEVKEFFGIPENVGTAALIPLGYPAQGEKFGGSSRRPLAEVAFYERWGQGR